MDDTYAINVAKTEYREGFQQEIPGWRPKTGARTWGTRRRRSCTLLSTICL